MSRLEHETKPGKLPVYLNIGKYSIRVSRAPNAQVLGMSKREMFERFDHKGSGAHDGYKREHSTNLSTKSRHQTWSRI